jgi:acetyl-CoA C-acetyltransferase
MVLAAEGTAGGDPVWVDGVGWNQDAPSIESREWGSAPAARRAGEMAYGDADITAEDVEYAEVDDTFAYKQLQHLDAIGLGSLNPARVNISGGALGEGYLHEANGLARALACVERVRADDARVAVAQSWRGIPSTSAAVVVMRGG